MHITTLIEFPCYLMVVKYASLFKVDASMTFPNREEDDATAAG